MKQEAEARIFCLHKIHNGLKYARDANRVFTELGDKRMMARGKPMISDLLGSEGLQRYTDALWYAKEALKDCNAIQKRWGSKGEVTPDMRTRIRVLCRLIDCNLCILQKELKELAETRDQDVQGRLRAGTALGD